MPDSFNRVDAIARKPCAVISSLAYPHLGFGHGTHFCLGAHLARMEMQVIISTLFTRFSDLRLAVPDGDVRWKVGSSVWGLAELPVAFST